MTTQYQIDAGESVVTTNPANRDTKFVLDGL